MLQDSPQEAHQTALNGLLPGAQRAIDEVYGPLLDASVTTEERLLRTSILLDYLSGAYRWTCFAFVALVLAALTSVVLDVLRVSTLLVGYQPSPLALAGIMLGTAIQVILVGFGIACFIIGFRKMREKTRYLSMPIPQMGSDETVAEVR